MEIKPQVFLDFGGPDGNTLAILAKCKRAARGAGWSEGTIDSFQRELLVSDREHVMDVLFECFDVCQTQVVAHSVGRDQVR